MKLRLIVFFILGVVIGTSLSFIVLKDYRKAGIPASSKTCNVDMSNPISQNCILKELSKQGIAKTQIPVTQYINISIKLSNITTKDGTFDSWQLPNDWNQYIYKNVSNQKKIDKFSNNLFLYITLQGVVFLYSPPDERYWTPIPMFGDIPPGAIIVGQHVPIKIAVNNGIMPVYHGTAYTELNLLPSIWKILLK